jgi:hypothetical protein
MKRSLISLILLASQLKGISQFYQAIHGSNYAGSLGVQNNPSSSLSSPNPWDITALGFQISNSSNIFYLQRYALDGKNKQLLAFFKNGDFEKNINFNSNINLFNARMRITNRLALGMGINIRTHGKGQSSTYNFQDSLSNLNSFMLINDGNQPLKASFLNSTWTEVFGNLAYNLVDAKKWIWNFGLNMKVNKGLMGIKTQLNHASFNRVLPNVPVYQLTDLDLQYTYSANLDKWDLSSSTISNLEKLVLNGEGGMSIDLGTEWFIKNLNDQDLFEQSTQYNYTWKFGLSVLDLGFSRYKNGLLNAKVKGLVRNMNVPDLALKFDSTIVDLNSFNDSLTTMVSSFQYESYFSKFKIFHPARLVINIDRPITDIFSINAEINLPASILQASSLNSFQAMSSLTLTPRIEDHRRGVYLPMTMNSQGYFWLGAAIKTGPLLLGIHNILPFFQKMPYANSGGYLAYVISPSEKLRKPKRKDVKCPD